MISVASTKEAHESKQSQQHTLIFPLSESIALLGGVFLARLIYGETRSQMKPIGVMLGLMT
jgi:hypothetical protein